MGAKKILVVDDSLTIQKVIRLALANEGYEIQAVSNGNDVHSTLSLFRPQVVLIDFSIPGKSAFEIRSESLRTPDLAHIKFVVMSSAFENVDEAKLSEQRFDGRLVKPFDPSHLRQVLDEVFKKSAQSKGSSMPSLGSAAMEDPSGLIKKMPPASIPQAPHIPHVPPISQSAPAIPHQNEPTLSFESPNFFGTEEVSHAPPKPLAPPPFSAPKTAPPTPPRQPKQDLTLESLGVTGRGTEDDIKNLTETTIKMSGLDNFQWSVNDDAIRNTGSQPTSQRPPNPYAANQFEVDQMQATEPDLAPPVNYLDKTDASLRVPTAGFAGNDTLQIDAVEYPDQYQPQTHNISFDSPIETYQNPSSFEAPPYSPIQKDAHESSVVPLSTEQMEKLLGTQLEQTLERVARRILPDIAEKVIREEIRRILSEPPV